MVWGCDTYQSESVVTPLVVSQLAAGYRERITSFSRVIPALGLTSDNQSELALAHALLQLGAHIGPPDDIRYSPFQQVLTRLEAASVNPNALRFLRQLFNAASDQYERG